MTMAVIKCHTEQLMNEAEYLMKNYEDRGRCYSSRP